MLKTSKKLLQFIWLSILIIFHLSFSDNNQKPDTNEMSNESVGNVQFYLKNGSVKTATLISFVNDSIFIEAEKVEGKKYYPVFHKNYFTQIIGPSGKELDLSQSECSSVNSSTCWKNANTIKNEYISGIRYKNNLIPVIIHFKNGIEKDVLLDSITTDSLYVYHENIDGDTVRFSYFKKSIYFVASIENISILRLGCKNCSYNNISDSSLWVWIDSAMIVEDIANKNDLFLYIYAWMYLKHSKINVFITNEQAARKLLLISANNGNIKARYLYGKTYFEFDDLQSFKRDWHGVLRFQEAANAGYPQAQYAAGMCFYFKRSDGDDINRAFEYLNTAASQGHYLAEYTLGKLYLKNIGYTSNLWHSADTTEAIKWLGLSIQHGYAPAKFLLDTVLQNTVVSQNNDELIRQTLGADADSLRKLLSNEFNASFVVQNDTVFVSYNSYNYYLTDLIKTRKNNRYGFINIQKRIFVQPIYESVGVFKNGLAKVSTDTYHYGFIDTTGKCVIECNFHEIRDFYENLAPAKIYTDDKYLWGYITKTGEWFIPPIYSNADVFMCGRAVVKTTDNLFGAIDKKGQMVITPKYHTAKELFINHFNYCPGTYKPLVYGILIETQSAFAIKFMKRGPDEITKRERFIWGFYTMNKSEAWVFNKLSIRDTEIPNKIYTRMALHIDKEKETVIDILFLD